MIKEGNLQKNIKIKVFRLMYFVFLISKMQVSAQNETAAY